MRTSLKIATLALAFASGAHSEETSGLEAISFDKLGDLEVTSVSKQPERSFESAAAIHVITSEEIKRSGASSVPEALRYVPGLEVARIDSNRWAISARGFNREFANKLLVLVDGRSVYTPLFSGVYWDMQDMPLEDIDRIEVIRGPGATMWGSNAVNGVINIITKDSKFTQGNYLSLAGGTLENGIGEARHGGKIDDDVFYRISGRHVDIDANQLRSGDDAKDNSKRSTANFRVDWTTDPQNNITLITNATAGKNNRLYKTPVHDNAVGSVEDFTGLNTLLHWENNGDGTNSQFQVYVDYIKRSTELMLNQENLTFDFDWQHNSNLNDRFNLLWGVGYRYFSDDLSSKPDDGVILLGYDPSHSNNSLYSGFVQGKYNLVPNELNFTLGSKFEHNFYTGFEYQPNVRLSWTPSQDQTVWGAVSRAVRIPSRGERTIALVSSRVAPNTYLRAFGQDAYKSEDMTAYEIGYRVEPYRWLMFDIASFYNRYNDLRSFELNGTLSVPIQNKMNAEAKGFEVTTRFMPDPDLIISASYSYLNMDVYGDADSRDTLTPTDEGTSPRHTLNILTRYNLQEDLYVDANLSNRSKLKTYNIGDQTRFDLTLTWRPVEAVEFSIAGQNLTDSYHQEFMPGTFGVATEIPRSVLGKVVMTF